jgi:cation/acetate symporter
MTINAQVFRAFWGMPPGQQLWFGIHPVSAGVFGVPVGFLVAIVVSGLTLRSAARAQQGAAESA